MLRRSQEFHVRIIHAIEPSAFIMYAVEQTGSGCNFNVADQSSRSALNTGRILMWIRLVDLPLGHRYEVSPSTGTGDASNETKASRGMAENILEQERGFLTQSGYGSRLALWSQRPVCHCIGLWNAMTGSRLHHQRLTFRPSLQSRRGCVGFPASQRYFTSPDAKEGAARALDSQRNQ